jgi:hypothetical protein
MLPGACWTYICKDRSPFPKKCLKHFSNKKKWITLPSILVRCLSGRKDMFAKHAYGKPYRGFESLPHRRMHQMRSRYCGTFCFSEGLKALLSRTWRKIKNSATSHLMLTLGESEIIENNLSHRTLIFSDEIR